MVGGGTMVTLLKEVYPYYCKEFIFIVILEKMHVRRSQEGYIWHSRGITTLLDKTIQNPILNGLLEK